MNLPVKTTQSTVVDVYYDPQMVCGVLYVWPTTSDPKEKLVLTVDRPIQDMVSDTDTFDLPQEWQNFLTFGLALQIEGEYPLTNVNYQKLLNNYIESKKIVEQYDRDPASTFFEMEFIR
jgi:hypothetical protein